MTLRPKFWETHSLAEMTRPEWEALCDGCGKCCLNKLEDEDSGEVAYTRVACRLFDGATCQCGNYANRFEHVPECIYLDLESLESAVHWLPRSCAYKTLHEGRSLPKWHPLKTGDPQSTHRYRSIKGITVSEAQVPIDDWEDYIIQEDI